MLSPIFRPAIAQTPPARPTQDDNALVPAEILFPDTDNQADAQADLITDLARHIQKCYDVAKHHRETSGIDEEIENSERQFKGEYDPEDKALIDKIGGSQQFFNITETKVNAGVAWVCDTLNPARGLPASVKSTIIPELTPEHMEQIQDRMVDEAETNGLLEALFAGEVGEDQIAALLQPMREEILREVKELAWDKAQKLQAKVRDRLHEGGFVGQFKDFAHNLLQFPAAVLKGPVDAPRIVIKRAPDGRMRTVTEIAAAVKAVSPHYYYPEPNAPRPEDGYVCEVVTIDAETLSGMRQWGRGWQRDAIERVLDQPYGPTDRVTIEDDSTLPDLENRDTTHHGGFTGNLRVGIEFWGKVQGKMLAEWGLPVDDPYKFYAIQAILMAGEIVFVREAPTYLQGKPPYFATSYKKGVRSQWGTGVPQAMRWCQHAYNVCMRSGMNGLAINASVYKTVDLDSMEPDETDGIYETYPGQTISFHSTLAQNSDPVRWFQPNINVSAHFQAAGLMSDLADDATLIPKYQHGNADVKGAGETAAGMEMLMSAAAKGIRQTLFNIDEDVLRPLVEVFAYREMELDADLIGDIRITPHGSLETLIRQEQAMRAMTMLERTNNDRDAQYIQDKHRRNAWEMIFKLNDLPVDRMIASEDEFASFQREQEVRMREQQQMALEGVVPGDMPPGRGQQPEPKQRRLGTPVGVPA